MHWAQLDNTNSLPKCQWRRIGQPKSSRMWISGIIGSSRERIRGSKVPSGGIGRIIAGSIAERHGGSPCRSRCITGIARRGGGRGGGGKVSWTHGRVMITVGRGLNGGGWAWHVGWHWERRIIRGIRGCGIIDWRRGWWRGGGRGVIV